MKKEEIKSPGVEAGSGTLRLLVCDTAGGIIDPPPQEEWVTSPIQCLDMVVDWKPKNIVVSFGWISLLEREVLVELSSALKRNSHTQECPVLALLYSKHRKLIEDLQRAKVDHVRYIGGAKLSARLVREIIEGVGPGDSPDRHLESLCHFLHYSKIDSHRELTLCGAYLDRMALGGRRLHELCETEDHLKCEYYLNPRRKS